MSLRENLAEENLILDRPIQSIDQWHLAPRARLVDKYQWTQYCSTLVNGLKMFQRSVGSIGGENGEGIS